MTIHLKPGSFREMTIHLEMSSHFGRPYERYICHLSQFQLTCDFYLISCNIASNHINIPQVLDFCKNIRKERKGEAESEAEE